jgi:hypothetical protein
LNFSQSGERPESADAGSALDALHLKLDPLGKVTPVPESGG